MFNSKTGGHFQVRDGLPGNISIISFGNQVQGDADGSITIEGEIIPISGYWLNTPTGRLFIAGSFETQNPNRRRASFSDINAAGLSDIKSYAEIIAANPEIFMAAAQRRRTEMLAIIENLPPEVVSSIPAYALKDLRGISDEEFAARMAAVPTAMNVRGWLNDYRRIGVEGLESLTPELTFLQRQLFGLIPPDAPIIGSNRPFGDLQSAGLLELRFSEFNDLVQETNFSIGNSEFAISRVGATFERYYTFNQSTFRFTDECADDPVPCYSDYVATGISSLMENNPQILADVMAKRFLLQNLQFIKDWDTEEVIRELNANDVNSYWHMTSPTAYAINYSRIGWGDPPRGNDGKPLEEWAEIYDRSIMYFRSVFGSTEFSSLIRPSEQEKINPSMG